jgi:hypothetical protein
LGFFGDFIRCTKASRRFGHGTRQMRRDEFANARDTFIGALQLLGVDEPKNVTGAVWFSARFQALKGLAHCAAKLGDVPLARSSIEEAMALWDTANLGPESKYPGLPEWMAWARSYLASSQSGDMH